MLNIDKAGLVQHPKVRLTQNIVGTGSIKTKNKAVSPLIERGALSVVRGIIVHQTDTPAALNTFNSYFNDKNPNGTPRYPNGAHFLIDKDGTIYQTASVYKFTNHVGTLRARCLQKLVCPPEELEKGLDTWNKRPSSENAQKSYENEKKKDHPDRFPKNDDSIGVECVGKALDVFDADGKPVMQRGSQRKDFEPLTDKQRESLKWLLRELADEFKVHFSEIYRHPEVSFKNPTEAESAASTIEELRAEAKKKATEAKTEEKAEAVQ